MIEGLPEQESVRRLLEAAFDKWAPLAKVALQSISPGHSGASLFKADVRQEAGELASGVHILKVNPRIQWHDQVPEFEAHQRSFERDSDFSRKHIPNLIAHYPAEGEASDDGYAMLFEVAGGSLDRFSPADTPQDGNFQRCATQILSCLLEAWADKEPRGDASPNEILRDLCGYRLNEGEAPDLHKLVNRYCQGPYFAVAGEVLINPLHFLSLVTEESLPASATLRGLTHGDLHGGNILLHRLQPSEHPFFVIDFALSRDGPIGYDAAYLELSHALAALGDEDPALLVGAVRSAEDPRDRNSLPGQAHWTKDVISLMRSALAKWRESHHKYRADQIDRQLALCRIAAGINWANKPIKESWRVAALCYAGWAARQYLRLHAPKLWALMQTRKSKPAKAAAARADDDLWDELWQATNGFDASRGKFILVSERLKGEDALRALGQLPWSAVIDLDPASDKDGLHRFAEPLLRVRRAVHFFTTKLPLFDARRGTGWMMAAGWAARSEYFPNYHEWRWDRLPVIRDFLREIFDRISPEPIHAVILPGDTLDPDSPGARISSIVGVIDEVSRGRALVHLLGSRQLSESAQQMSSLPLEPTIFARKAAAVFGTAFTARTAQVPGPERDARTIAPDLLRAMQENMHVLHSSILDEQPEAPSELTSEFWRGRPPNWAELHAGFDIPREIDSELLRTLREKLSAHRNQTVILEHSPGAGGTTAALRAAWDLRGEYPVAIMHKYSDALPERVRELFQLAERPVLLVAEAGDLTETDREELYRYFAKNNSRVVLLYLRRSLGRTEGASITIQDPMSKSEAQSFLAVYSDLTIESRRRKELMRIVGEKELSQYRVPFFFGLITFERDFVGIDRYVENHLKGARRPVRSTLEHLSLVTIYSNGGISLALLKALMGGDPKSDVSVADLIGEGPARLLIGRAGGIRFMHQIIAEQVLAHFQGGGADDWRLDLKSYAEDFIRNSVSAAGPEAMRPLFRQMFVDRMGTTDGVDDREDFAPIVENLDALDSTLGHSVLEYLAEQCPEESHFWSHLGRHQVYRLRRDYELAEEYLRKAIELNPIDPTHHHTFGLVLKSRLRHELRSLPKTSDLTTVFDALDPLFGRAAGAFQETRRLSPDNVYGYITHIQLIVGAARRLKDAVGETTIARVGLEHSAIDSWLSDNLPLAEQLLREANHLYGTLDTSSEYLLHCEADLDQLYGEIENVIELWELASATGRTGSRGRRALANAYLIRNERRWRGLGLPEIRRIVELMEENLREGDRRDDDYHMWFNAYILLPEFDMDEALSQLALWSKRFPSWRAHYYIYVLHFMLWYRARTNDINAYEQALDACKSRHIGRRTSSSLWFGQSRNSSGLVSEDDLGSWKADVNFFGSPDMLLPVNGIIERITGPQAGQILIEGRVRAFFVPGRNFSAHRDENKPVHFFIGFSPAGLRAWSVEAGHVAGADRAKVPGALPGSMPVPTFEQEKRPAFKTARAKTLRRGRVLAFAAELIRAKARIGAPLSIEELRARIDALLRIDGASEVLGIEDLAGAVAEAGDIEVREKAGETIFSLKTPIEDPGEPATPLARKQGFVARYDEQKNYGFIGDGSGDDYFFHRDYVLPTFRRGIRNDVVVDFTPEVSEKGPIARGITILNGYVWTHGGTLPEAKLAPALEEFVHAKVVRAPADGIERDELVRLIRTAFRSTKSFEVLLGVKVSFFISKIEGLTYFKNTGRVALSKQPAFGRLPAKGKRGSSDEVTAPTSRAKSIRRQSPLETKEARSTKAISSSVDQAMRQADVKRGAKVPLETAALVKADIASQIEAAQQRGRPMLLTQLGDYLADLYPGSRKAYSRLGYKNTPELLKSIGGISIGSRPKSELRIDRSLAEE